MVKFMKTIVFLSGFALPKFISKSSWFFEDSFWKDYRRIFYKSKTPTSDKMVVQELENLKQLVNSYSDTIVVGHSLGAWWAANLACLPQSKIKKLALWTPLGVASDYPIFKISQKSELFDKTPNIHNVGPDKTLVIYAKNDLIVPYKRHAIPLSKKFQAMSLSLDGGHAWQLDHKKGLILLKNWIELE